MIDEIEVRLRLVESVSKYWMSLNGTTGILDACEKLEAYILQDKVETPPKTAGKKAAYTGR